MDTSDLNNNHIILAGKVASKIELSYEKYGEKFYEFNLSVKKFNSDFCTIPIKISEKLLPKQGINVNDEIKIQGKMISYNKFENEENSLVLIFLATEIEFVKLDDDEESIFNKVVLKGCICKKPIYRQTPFGREIADLLIAVDRTKYERDYIPVVIWGRSARLCKDLEIGANIEIVGKVSVISYKLLNPDGTREEIIRYEVSSVIISVIK